MKQENRRKLNSIKNNKQKEATLIYKHLNLSTQQNMNSEFIYFDWYNNEIFDQPTTKFKTQTRLSTNTSNLIIID